MATAATASARRAATAPARGARSGNRPAPRRARAGRQARQRAPAPTARPAPLAQMPARLVPLAVGRTATAVSGLADSFVVHRLTRGRLWIGALTTLLVGIVALNVLALSFNASASKVGRQADVLKREISALRARIAAAGASNERVQAAAANLGLVVPEPGSISYPTPSPDDAAVAARRLASGELAAAPLYTAPAAPASAPTGAPAAVPTTEPAAPAQPAQDEVATGTGTADTTSPPPAPAGAQGGGGTQPAGAGGVATP